MAVMTRDEALDLKRSLRRAVLTAVIETLRDGLTSKLNSTTDPRLLKEVEARLRTLKQLLLRVDIEDVLQVVIDQQGIHVLDRGVEFHL